MAPKNHVCPFCNKTFTCGQKKFKIHISAVHFNLKNHVCDICKKEFTYAGNLKTHIRSVHEKFKPHKCQQCGHNFRSNWHLNEHIKKKIMDVIFAPKHFLKPPREMCTYLSHIMEKENHSIVINVGEVSVCLNCYLDIIQECTKTLCINMHVKFAIRHTNQILI